ncbi:hypothetical protein PVAP13_2NG465600 [Panicum virgatum]|uniref:Uncharacterized protein n=1 Tax=Panicum virgatum TaxID=38727 RepID=A0A8T0VJ67_PANVG|nr:hypothetical protein PVAP13_2NG465600 [Panicum virgatum]
MVAGKRAAADPTKSSNENKRTCSAEGGTTESLISDELCCDYQRIQSELGEQVSTDLFRSVATLVLSHGHEVLFACSGVAIERRRLFTRFVTAASLVRALHSDVKIDVCYEGKIVIGVLEDFDLDHKIAFVQAMENLDVYCVPLNPVVEWMPETAVVAVARDVSGKLMATTGKLERSDGEAGGHHIMFSTTCKLPEGWQGGASFDFDGNFVGMNLDLDMRLPIILPRSTILERWKHLRTPQSSSLQPPARVSCLFFQGVKPYSRPQAYEDVPSNAEFENGSRGPPPPPPPPPPVHQGVRSIVASLCLMLIMILLVMCVLMVSGRLG